MRPTFTQPFYVRRLAADDIALIQQVGRATYEPYYPHIWKEGGLDWYMEKCFGAETLRTELADRNIEFLLAQDAEGCPIGFLKLWLLKPTPDGSMSNALYLEKIYLMPEYFGKGAGQKLMEWVCDKAAQLGREAVWLIVMEHGPVEAYERAGFHRIGEERWEFELLRDTERLGWVMLRTLQSDQMLKNQT